MESSFQTCKYNLTLFTLEVDVPQVQHGRQQLQDLPAFRLREEQIHRRANARVVLGVVPAVTDHAAALQHKKKEVAGRSGRRRRRLREPPLHYLGEERIILSTSQAPSPLLLRREPRQHAVKYVVVSLLRGLRLWKKLFLDLSSYNAVWKSRDVLLVRLGYRKIWSEPDRHYHLQPPGGALGS